MTPCDISTNIIWYVVKQQHADSCWQEGSRKVECSNIFQTLIMPHNPILPLKTYGTDEWGIQVMMPCDISTKIKWEEFCKTPLVQVTVGLHDLPAYQILGNPCVWRSLFPTTPLDDLGPQPLSVVIRDGRHKKFNGVFEVVQTDFPVESLWFNDTKSSIRGTEKELAAVQGFVSNQLSVQYWDGPFVSPASEGEVTTEYGVRRYYNGAFAERYFHQGIDYGADKGTPVRAPATGCVTLIGREKDGFELHGNCVGIDHGQGVTIILMHLSCICIEEGTTVQAGDIVGKVGETGLATGPHLHWGLFVNGKAVNPNPWLQKAT